MTDREMLELAARAAGYEVRWVDGPTHFNYTGFRIVDDGPEAFNGVSLDRQWNPLKNKADAFDLMVKLHLLIMPYPLDKCVRVTRLDQPDTVTFWKVHNNDPATATMLAITRAAAEIGKLM